MMASAAGKYILKCLLSPDVRQLATASSDKTVKLWNLDGFTLERTLTGTPMSTLILAVPSVQHWSAFSWWSHLGVFARLVSLHDTCSVLHVTCMTFANIFWHVKEVMVVSGASSRVLID